MDENNMLEVNANEVTDAVAEAVAEPVAEEVVEAVEETVIESAAEEVVEPVAEAVVEPVAEAVVEPAAEAVAENNTYEYGAVENTYDYVSDNAEVKPAGNGLAIAALICGIASIVCYCWGFGVLPGIAAIVCGIIGRKKCEKKAMATWGLVLGIISVVILLCVILLSILAPIFGFTGIMGLSIFEAFEMMENSSYYY